MESNLDLKHKINLISLKYTQTLCCCTYREGNVSQIQCEECFDFAWKFEK